MKGRCTTDALTSVLHV